MTIDDMRFDAAVARGFIAFSRIVGWTLAAIALALLAAWIGSFGSLRALLQSDFAMHAGAAVACLLACAALVLGKRAARASLAISLLLAAYGAAELSCRVFAPDLGIRNGLDALLPAWPGRPPARMTGLAAAGFALLGVVGAAVVLERAVWLREACALAVIAIAVASSTAYGLLLSGEAADLLSRLPAMTAVSLLLLALAWMASVPTTGLTRVAVADSAGGAFARRLILPSLLLPAVLTFAFKHVQLQLHLPEAMTLALATAATGGAVATMIVWVAFLLDRGERQRRAVAALRADASTDALTQLANRREFDTVLAQLLHERGDGALALLMLDLDRFKVFNDRFGHQAGDEVLRETGRLLRAEVRPRDLVARYGGEEFAIVLPESDAQRAQRVGERILAAFRTNAWPLHPVTLSIGAAIAVPGDTPQSLAQRADAALYRSKQEGRDRFTADAGCAPTVAPG
ncbi:MAG: GGDEF domain-containing protein [Proteobacteria bacterium]|nr:GGDEF domain-containing protein [Pseudomonadota bacterium]